MGANNSVTLKTLLF